jgi:aquaporin NIP
MRRYLCEGIGTFFLVFAGTGAVIANDLFGGQITHVGIALSFGFVVMAVIYAFGSVSGAHINPAVTLGFCVIKRLSLHDAIKYIISQCLGACVASVMLAVMYQNHKSLGATLPAINVWGAFVYEFLLTWFLMMVILSVATGAKEKGLMAGVAIGGTVALEALFAGPVTGASMNPARSLAPALISGNISDLWIYIFAPILGAVLASLSCHYLHKGDCCSN